MNSFHFSERGGSKLPSLYTLPIYDFDLRATHARTLLPAALASVSSGFVLVRVRVRRRAKTRIGGEDEKGEQLQFPFPTEEELSRKWDQETRDR